MDSEQAFAIVIREGSGENGMVVETRSGIDPGVERVRELECALEVVARVIDSDATIDRALANALYGLSFHMSETLNHWQQCDWISKYTVILSKIEAIFEGTAPEKCKTKS
jgi:hypothetical protein